MGLLYTKYKMFHYQEKLKSLPSSNENLLAPIHVRIKPTNICNHRCRYCAYRAKDLQLGQDMNATDTIPKDKLLEIIDDLSEMKVQAVTFSGGGEPFCYPGFANILKRLTTSDISFATLTNGSMLKGEAAEIFAHHGTWVRVSMDGWDDQSYTMYRNTSNGEYSKIIENMKRFKKLGGKCYLGVSLIIDRNNHDKIVESIHRLFDIGVDSVKLSPCIVSNSGQENNAYHRPFFDAAKEQIHHARQSFEKDGFEIYDSYHEIDGKFEKSYTWCPYQQILPVIGADLNIYPCQDKAYNLHDGVLGSIKRKRFKAFWFESKERYFRINPSVTCPHHCVANEKNQMLYEYLKADKNHLGFV